MIYTCTLNPAIDLFIQTPSLQEGLVNRCDFSEMSANGKGVNVSFILKLLEIENTAMGIGGGFTNRYIEEELENAGIACDFVHTKEPTRINVFTRVSSTNEEFKLVNPGPMVEQEQLEAFLAKIKKLNADDFLVISGSFSKGIPPEILIDIAKISQEKGFRLILDTSYPEVLQTLSYQPFLLKPNDEEIMAWFQLEKEPSVSELIEYARKLVNKGAQQVLLSLGSRGAVYLSKTHTIWGNAPRGVAVNTACAGDSMLGAFLAGLVENKELCTNLAFAIAAGSSTAFRVGLTDFTDVVQLLREIEIKEME